ncbi:glutaredoxin [Shewanella sp. AS16]|uniref:glutaredoxin n=1 Tax=Shewanella sp. AS16 TaxID=2907625 RepID=UPI001F1871F1|nr:glutaredoxin [Shewanella sp. AS16]MCE9686257.1 glutaredoxin [Shewanella sp. AS16]
MKNLMLILLLGFCVYQGWQDFGPRPALVPLYDAPYVAVYGRDSCGHTQRLLRELRREGLAPHYFNVDDAEVADSLHERMESQGMSTKRYDLPVVDVNAKFSIRPPLAGVRADLQATN